MTRRLLTPWGQDPIAHITEPHHCTTMTLALCFYICMLLWLVLGAVNSWPNWRAGAPDLLLFIMLGLLGYKCFGPALHG